MSCLRSLAVSAASLLVGCMGVSGGSEGSEATSEPSLGEAAESVIGIANPPCPSNYLNVRTGPGLGYSMVRQVPRGQSIYVVCSAIGDYVNGTRQWYQLGDGSFVTSAGVNAWGVPACGGFDRQLP